MIIKTLRTTREEKQMRVEGKIERKSLIWILMRINMDINEDLLSSYIYIYITRESIEISKM